MITRENQPLDEPCPFRRRTDQGHGIRVATEAPVERHDIRVVDLGGMPYEVAVDELETVQQVRLAGDQSRDLEVGVGRLDEDGVASPRGQQIAVDGADAPADIEDRLGADAVRSDQVEQESGGVARPVPSKCSPSSATPRSNVVVRPSQPHSSIATSPA